MWYRVLLPHHHLILDALVAAVLLAILGLTSSFFIQALVDSVFVLGRKPALNWLGLGMLLVMLARAGFFGLRSHLLAHLSRRIEAETVIGYHRRPQGLPLDLLNLIMDSLLIFPPIGVLLWMDWKLALQSLQLLPALAGIAWLLNKRTSQPCIATISHFVRDVSMLGLLWFGGHKVLDGHLTVGQLMAMHVILATILAPIDRLVNHLGDEHSSDAPRYSLTREEVAHR